MDKSQKKRWRNMLVVALSDKCLTGQEKAYLEKVRTEFGISTEEAQQIAAEIKQGKTILQIKGGHKEKVEMLRDIIKISLVDGVLDERETLMIRKTASHIGLNEEQCTKVIEECGGKSAINKRKDTGKAEVVSCSAAKNTTAPASVVTAQPNAVSGKIHVKTGIELLTIQTATFCFGSGAVGGENRQSELKSYLIAVHPVTNKQYRLFEEATGRQGREGYGERFNDPECPVVGINYFDAKEFCKWGGLRLPTEHEWEYAARGDDDRLYPWGNNYPSIELCNYGRNLFGKELAATSKIGSYPKGVSAMGCFDMSGNVAEWCKAAKKAEDKRVPTRGGHWLSASYALNVCYHDRLSADTRNNRVGFRVAADLGAV